jgi:hypothetical protein
MTVLGSTTRDVINSRLPDHRNHWPSDLELVIINEYNLSDPTQAFDFAFIYGTAVAAGVYRQVTERNLPQELRVTLKRDKNLWFLNQTWFILASPHGQEDDEATRNLLGVIGPRKDYNFETMTNEFTSSGLIIEVGCRHEYETKKLGNCYHGGTCIRCGHEWKVDSSG